MAAILDKKIMASVVPENRTEPELVVSGILDSFFGSSWEEAKFVGSLGEWLACLVLNKGLFLLNIASTSCIRLSDNKLNNSKFERLHCHPLSDRKIHRFAARKVVFCSPPSSPANCVVVCFDGFGDLSFCRLGDAAWTTFYERKPFRPMLKDIIFIKDQLFAIDVDGKLMVFDSGFNSNPTVLDFPPFGSHAYLANAVSDDKLLVIVKTDGVFNVFEIDPKNLSFIDVEGLGDHSVFLVRPCSITLSATEQAEFKPNHIYIDDPQDGVFYDFSLDRRIIEIKRNGSARGHVFFSLFRGAGFVKQRKTKYNPWLLPLFCFSLILLEKFAR